LLLKNQPQKALICLRKQITPISNESQKEILDKLSRLLLCRNPDLILQQASSLGIEGGSRKDVLDKIKRIKFYF
jgi:hypothetical protein